MVSGYSRRRSGGECVQVAEAAIEVPRHDSHAVKLRAMIGTVLGLLAAFGAAQLVQGLLYNVEAIDPVAFTTVPLLLVGVAALAVYLPARRAASVEPMRALKAD